MTTLTVTSTASWQIAVRTPVVTQYRRRKLTSESVLQYKCDLHVYLFSFKMNSLFKTCPYTVEQKAEASSNPKVRDKRYAKTFVKNPLLIVTKQIE